MSAYATLYAGLLAAWVLGMVLHEGTHYVVAQVAGARDVRVEWPSIWARPSVVYEVPAMPVRRQQWLVYTVNLAPFLVGVVGSLAYLLWFGVPEVSALSLVGGAFVVSYGFMGGVADYSWSHAILTES